MVWIVLAAVVVFFLIKAIWKITSDVAKDKREKKAFENNEDLQLERDLYEYIPIKPKEYTYNYYDYKKREEYRAVFRENAILYTDYIKHGACIVLLNGIRPSRDYGKVKYKVFTRNMVLPGKTYMKDCLSIFNFESDKLLEESKATYVVEDKKASVVKQAVVGGVIAGGVGAVVGAANAINQNINSPGSHEETKTVYTRTGGTYASLTMGSYYPEKCNLECIIISKELANEVDGFPIELVTEETDNAYIFANTYSGEFFDANDFHASEYKQIYDYFEKVLHYLKQNSKY